MSKSSAFARSQPVRYQRAFVDFFEDELVLSGYDWRKILSEYLFKGKEPLANCLIAGRMSTFSNENGLVADQTLLVGHPLIHLGYAFEISSRDIAMESLGMATTCYNYLHKYLDDPSYTKPSVYTTPSPLEILQRIREDKQFDGVFDHPGNSLEELFEKHEDALLEHWNAWRLSEPRKQFEDSQQAAVALLVATHEPGHQYDFFLVHLLTTTHAVRIVLPFIPTKFHVPLLRQWWLLTLAVYVGQLRPAIDFDNIRKYDLGGKDWDWNLKQAVEGKHSKDPHYVKAIRAMKEAAKTWGDDDQFYVKAAAKFATEFDGWGGFATSDIDEETKAGFSGYTVN